MEGKGGGKGKGEKGGKEWGRTPSIISGYATGGIARFLRNSTTFLFIMLADGHSRRKSHRKSGIPAAKHANTFQRVAKSDPFTSLLSASQMSKTPCSVWTALTLCVLRQKWDRQFVLTAVSEA